MLRANARLAPTGVDAFFFLLRRLPPTPLAPSFISFITSLTVTILLSSVVAIFSATIIGSIKSINILPGEDAKSAPAFIIASK